MSIITTSPQKAILKIKVLAMMLLIIIASIWFALHSHPVRHVVPDLVMKQESAVEMGRTILVNVPRMKGNGYTVVMEV